MVPFALTNAERLLPFWEQLCQAQGLSEFDELSHALAASTRETRSGMLGFIENALPVLGRLSGLDVLRTTVQATLDVTSWWS